MLAGNHWKLIRQGSSRMGRRRSSSNDSLDLLLDTMCNTFGGIVFIAMLLAILAQTTKVVVEDPQAVASARLRMETNRLDLQNEVASLDIELLELSPLHAVNKARVIEYESNPKMAKFDQLSELRKRRAKLQASLADLKAKLSEQHGQSTAAAASEAQLKKKLLRLAAEVTQLERDLATASRGKVRKFRLPEERATTKVNISTILQGGEFFYVHRVSDGRASHESYDPACLVSDESDDGVVIIQPIAGSGHRVDTSDAVQRALAPISYRSTAQAYYLEVAVYGDSIREFVRLKEQLNAKGFNYNWLPMSDGSTVMMAPSEGRTVQ